MWPFSWFYEKVNRLADTIAYRLTKWWFSKKYRRFLSPKQFNAMMRFYDKIYEEA